jgi:hypothetical protein
MASSSLPSPLYQSLEQEEFRDDIEAYEKTRQGDKTQITLQPSVQHEIIPRVQPLHRARNHIFGLMFLLSTAIGLTSVYVLLRGQVINYQITHPGQASTMSNTLPHPGSPLPYVRRERPCGWTADEARAAGCTFDIMTSTWLPDECYDDDISSAFRTHGPWEFYTNSSDFEFTPTIRWPSADQLTLLPDEKAASEQRFVWATRRYHLTHCIFLLRRLHRLVDGGKRLDSALEDYHHSKHCGDMIEKSLDGGGSIPMDLVMTFVVIGYPSC